MDVKVEVTGHTQWGGPHILVTVAEGHEKAGFALLMKSCAGMDPHRGDPDLKPGEERYLIYDHPDERNTRGWHGAIHAVSDDAAVQDLIEYMEWLFEREQVSEALYFENLSELLSNFHYALRENGPRDYRKEWRAFLDEVAKVNMVMAALKEEK